MIFEVWADIEVRVIEVITHLQQSLVPMALQTNRIRLGKVGEQQNFLVTRKGNSGSPLLMVDEVLWHFEQLFFMMGRITS